jgi:hypothetical protein
MLNRPLDCYRFYEKECPGFIDMIVRYENAILPTCPYCGSWHTAQVAAGIVKPSMHLAGATTKFTLNPQRRGRLFCNECRKFFTPEDYEGPIWWHELIDVDEDDIE